MFLLYICKLSNQSDVGSSSTDQECDTSYEDEEDQYSILTEVELGHVRSLDMASNMATNKVFVALSHDGHPLSVYHDKAASYDDLPKRDNSVPVVGCQGDVPSKRVVPNRNKIDSATQSRPLIEGDSLGNRCAPPGKKRRRFVHSESNEGGVTEKAKVPKKGDARSIVDKKCLVKSLADKCDTIDKQAKDKESLAPKEHCQEKIHAISDETKIKSSIQQSSVGINLEGTLDVKCDEIKLLQVDINHSCSKGMNRKIDDEAGSSKLAKYVGLDLPQLSSKSCKNKRSRNSYGKKRPKPVLEEYNPGAPSPLDSLSDEIIVKIFEYLPRTTLVKGCAITCRRLRNISYDEALWKRVDLAGKKLGNVLFTYNLIFRYVLDTRPSSNIPNPFNKPYAAIIGPGQGGKIMARGTKVLRMARTHITSPLFDDTLQTGGNLSQNSLNSSLSSVASYLVPSLRLKYLDLGMATIDVGCLEKLFEKCRLLRKVGLEQCRVNDAILFQLSQNKGLQTLHMCVAQGVTAQGLFHLGTGLTDCLEDLNLSWIGMDDKMIQETILLLANNSKRIKRINISGCREWLTDDHIEAILGIFSWFHNQ